MPSPSKDRIKAAWLFPLAILILACVVRVIYLLQYQQLADWDQLTVDNWYHHNWAESIADGNIFGDTTYFRAPFYVYSLGLLYALLGSSLWVARLFGLVIGLGSVGMTYLIGRRLFGRRAGLIAAIFHAVYPIMIYFEGELLLDSLFTLTVQLAIHRFLVALDSGQKSDLFFTGLLVGLAAITRPTILVVVPLILILIVISVRRKQPIRRMAVFLIGLILSVAPVSVRNLIVAGDPVLISSQGGINLYIGNNDAADGFSAVMPEPLGHNWQIRRITYIAEEASGQALKPGEVSDYWRGEALKWIASHPGRFVSLFAKKVYYQFVDREISNNRALAPFLEKTGILSHNPLSFGVIFSLAVAGLLSGFKHDRKVAFVLLFMALYVITVSLFFYNSRFRLPLLPFYLVLAARGGLTTLEKLRQNRRKGMLYLGVIGVAAVFSFSPLLALPRGWSSQHLISKGIYHHMRREYQVSLAYFRQAARHDPTFPEVNLNIGACFFRLGQADSAMFYFERELKLHPGRPKSYHNPASLQLVNGQYEQARNWISSALKIAPYDVIAHKINLRALGGDTTIAGDSLVQAVEAASAATEQDLFVLNEGAYLLNERGQYQAAERFLLLALEATPPPIETDDLAFAPGFAHSHENYSREKARTSYLLGYLSGIRGDLKQAIDYSRRAISLDSSLVEAYINLAHGYLSSGRQGMADSVITIAARKFPDNPQLQQLLHGPRW